MFAELAEVVDTLDITAGPHALTHLMAITDRLNARVSAAVGELDASGGYGLDGSISTQAWLTHHGRHARPVAHAHVANARRLRNLPGVQSAWETGQISADQARIIARTIDARVTDRFNTAAPDLLPVLAPLSVRDIAYVCGVWNQQATVGLDDRPPTHATSGMHPNKTLDGTWHGDLTLDPDDGEIVDSALRQIIADDPLTSGDGTSIRTMPERHADARSALPLPRM